MAHTRDDARLAVLIDADNASAADLEVVLVEIAKLGVATVRRAYGDWTTTHLAKWKPLLLAHSVQPMQQFANTTGKNSTDSALIIDAMDLLHSGTVDGFCIVSSDSDFTRLAGRIREQGLMAYGFGERKTPPPFVSACTKFVYVENLRADAEEPAEVKAPAPATGKATAPGKAATPSASKAAAPASAGAATPPKRKAPPLASDRTLANLLAEAVDAAAGDDGWAHLGNVGSNLSKLRSDFDSRTWGHAKLTDLLTAHPAFEVELRSPGDGKTEVGFARRVTKK